MMNKTTKAILISVVATVFAACVLAGSNGVIKAFNEKANAIFKKLADGKDVHYLDIGDKFLETDGTLTRKIMPDLLHLSVEGYTIWAESIEPTLKKIMGE